MFIHARRCKTGRMESKTEVPKILISKREAAIALGVSVRTVDNLIQCKELQARRVGRRTLIAVAELERFARRDHRTKNVTSEVDKRRG